MLKVYNNDTSSNQGYLRLDTPYDSVPRLVLVDEDGNVRQLLMTFEDGSYQPISLGKAEANKYGVKVNESGFMACNSGG